YNYKPPPHQHLIETRHPSIHANKPSNNKRHCRNNQTNRVSLHRRVKNTHLYRSTRRGKLLCNQQAIPNSLTNSNRLQRQTVSRNATNNSGKDRPPFLEQAHNSRKNRRKLLNALNQRIRNGFNHRGEFVKHRNHGIADCVNDVVLSDLPLITERLRCLISGLHHLLESLASTVLHHVHNVRDVDLPLGSHFLDLINRHAELLRQPRQNRHARLRNHGEAVHHGDTAIIDGLHHAAHSLIKLRRVTTGSNNCLADVLQRARRVLALNARISQRLSSLQIRLIVQRGLRRYFPQVLHYCGSVFGRPVKTSQHLLRVLPRHSVLETAHKGRTNRCTHRSDTNNRASLQRFTRSLGHAGTHRLPRLITNLRDSLIHRLVKLRCQLRSTRKDADVGSPKLHGHMCPPFLPYAGTQRPATVLLRAS